jgi:hypothetical protein
VIAYRLTFDGALRVPVAGTLFPRSDTLHAALCTALAALGEDAGAVALDPPFALSSLFPWVRRRAPRGEPATAIAEGAAVPATEVAQPRAGDYLYFAPTPVGVSLAPIAPPVDATAPAIAPLSAPRYVSLPLLARLLSGESVSAPRAAAPEGMPPAPVTPPTSALQGGALWSDVPVGARLWVEESPMRRAMDRLTARPRAPAHVGGAVRFVPDAGLYFLAQPRDAEGRRLLEAGLAWLGDEGFARSAPFSVTRDETFTAPRTGSGATLLLSLYWPTEAEVRGGVLVGGRYGLVARDHTDGRRAERQAAHRARRRRRCHRRVGRARARLRRPC